MIEIKESQINGNGVFSTEDIPSGTEIGIWCSTDISKGVRTLYNEGMSCNWYETAILGRYCNHSLTPNTSVLANENELILVSNGINKDEEIIANYNWATEHTGYILDTTSID
jgi:SET domain-containing protein